MDDFKRRQLAEAKELFKQYRGSHFGMSHDGVYGKYKGYNISDVQENQWRLEICNEYINNNVIKSELDYKILCELGNDLVDVNIIKKIIYLPLSQNLDNSYVQILFMIKDSFKLLKNKKQLLSLEDITNFKNNFNNSWVKNFLLDFLKMVNDGNIEYDSYYFTDYEMIEKYLKEQQNFLNSI